MPRGRPRKDDENNVAIIKRRFWIWDSVWEEPREVEIAKSQRNERGEFLCWDSYEVEARGTKGWHFLHQIFSKKQLFATKKALCEHYIKMFEGFMEKDD